MEVARLERGCTCIISLTGVPLWPVAWFAGHSQGICTRVSHINHVARLGDRTGPGSSLPALCVARRLFTRDAGQLLSRTVRFSRSVPHKVQREERRKNAAQT